jgi:hypothetical protein
MTRPIQSHSKKPLAVRHRRIGRKVLLADRLARAVAPNTQKRRSNDWRVIFAKPKLAASIVIGVLVVGALGFTGIQAYSAQQAETRQAEATEQFALQKEKAAEADACRRAKLEQKADLVGKVTYDELYDGNECNK